MENTNEVSIGWTILIYGAWIGVIFLSARYSKGVAKELKMSESIAVLSGIFFPILGALIYSNLSYRAKNRKEGN